MMRKINPRLERAETVAKFIFESNFCGCSSSFCGNSSGSGASRDVKPGLDPGQKAEDCSCFASSTCAAWICLDITTFVPGRSVAAIRVKALLTKNPTCKVMGKI